MQRFTGYLIAATLLFAGCHHKAAEAVVTADPSPVITANGLQVTFPDSASSSFFEVEPVGDSTLSGTLHAPGKVAATVLHPDAGTQNIVLFDDPKLTGDYSQLLQHRININHIQNVNIKQKIIELERTQDLFDHGAASGKDILEAKSELSAEQTNLANERTQLIEHESSLKAAGFDPEALYRAAPGTAYIICDIPENQLNNVKKGAACSIMLSSLPDNTYSGKVEDIADVIDDVTRMIKLRIRLNATDTDIRAGMFANVTFQVKGDNNGINIARESMITADGQNYVFVRTSPNTFTRREIRTGQQLGDRVAVYSGLKKGEYVAVKGVMQLKGLSFGY